jgi:hypothetical protein
MFYKRLQRVEEHGDEGVDDDDHAGGGGGVHQRRARWGPGSISRGRAGPA